MEWVFAVLFWIAIIILIVLFIKGACGNDDF